MKTSLLSVLLALVSTVACAADTRLDLATGYPANSYHTQNIQQFAADLQKATGGKLKITVYPNGTLVKPGEIKASVESGKVPMGEFILSGAVAENAIYGVDAIPFLAVGYEEAMKLHLASKAAAEKQLAKQGLKLLFEVPWPPQGLYALKPIESGTDLKGAKMRAYNPATTRIAQYVGAEPTTIQLVDLNKALADRAVDAFLTSSASGVENKLYEQVKYFYPVAAWLPKNAIVINQKTFDQLDKSVQEAMTKAGAAAEARGWVMSEQKDQEYIKELESHGVQVRKPSDTLMREFKMIGGRMTTEWLKVAGADGQGIVDAYRK